MKVGRVLKVVIDGEDLKGSLGAATEKVCSPLDFDWERGTERSN